MPKMIREFTKANVLAELQEAKESPPTPTDGKHEAHWWNENFGMMIKSHYEIAIDALIANINRMPGK